jgi:hypothetical protein
MYENRMLREVFGPMREEVKGDWRKLHNEKLISFPNVCIIKLRRGWVGHVARMGGGQMHIGFWLGNLRERDNMEDLGVDGRMILQCMLKKSFGKAWTGLSWLRIATSGGLS